MSTNGQMVIPLYPGVAPGSENWTYCEQASDNPIPLIYNIAKPTLTVYRADPAKANGTAIVMCPGGGFLLLAQISECEELAHWLNERGINCIYAEIPVNATFYR